MEYDAPDAKARIMDTTVKLLLEGNGANKITTRLIAQKANVNSALINYYFHSKGNLLNEAVDICMGNLLNRMFEEDQIGQAPVVRLKGMLKSIATFAFNHYHLSEIVISSEVRSGSMLTTKTILPILKEMFGDTKTETEQKLIALQLIIPLQVIFLCAKEHTEYLSKDIFDESERNEILDTMVDNILSQGKGGIGK